MRALQLVRQSTPRFNTKRGCQQGIGSVKAPRLSGFSRPNPSHLHDALAPFGPVGGERHSYQCMLNPASTLVVVTPPEAGFST